jgi:magnesium transporter
MLKIYNTDNKTNKIKETEKIIKGCWINIIDPDEKEIDYLVNNIGINPDFIRYSLDIEERARIDIEDNQTLIIVDIPIEENRKKEVRSDFSTIPLGIIIVDDKYIITICNRNVEILKDFCDSKIKGISTHIKNNFVLQILYKIASNYLLFLKRINKETDKTECKLQNNLRNEELMKLLSLEKSLVYFTTSLRSNENVMEKLLKGVYLKLSIEDKDYLDDIIIENKQAIEMVTITRDILSGTTTAYASIISNNLNFVMKFLAAVTIVFSIPTMVSGLWGMNVDGILFSKSPFGFLIVVMIALLLSILSYIWLRKKNMW